MRGRQRPSPSYPGAGLTLRRGAAPGHGRRRRGRDRHREKFLGRVGAVHGSPETNPTRDIGTLSRKASRSSILSQSMSPRVRPTSASSSGATSQTSLSRTPTSSSSAAFLRSRLKACRLAAAPRQWQKPVVENTEKVELLVLHALSVPPSGLLIRGRAGWKDFMPPI